MFYNPNFQKSSIVFRIEPDEKIEKIKEGLESGKRMIAEIESKLDTSDIEWCGGRSYLVQKR